MAGYRMNLQKKYFNFVKNGTKRVELRLLDEKRQAIKVGDRIDFECDGATIATRVIGVLYYQNFKEIFEDLPMEKLAEKGFPKEELLKSLEEFYTPGLQSKYGVVGFRFELI